MSTRSVKKTTRTSMASTSAETSSVGTPGASSTPRVGSDSGMGTATPGSSHTSRSKSRTSPASPTRISRMKEKEDLQDLNNRLAAYIDRVRHLETENSRLNVQIETIQESVRKEASSMKSMYDQELEDARRLINEFAKEKAQLQINVGKLRADNDDLKVQLVRKDNELTSTEKSLSKAEVEVETLSKKLSTSENEKKKLLAEVADLRARVADLTRQLDEAKKQLEGEVLMRVDLENRCQGLKEEYAFKTQIHEQQMSEIQKRKTVEISEIDGELKEKYEARMHDVLQELREQYEEQLAENRGQIEMLYETKLDELSRKAELHSNDAEMLNSTLKESQNRSRELQSRLAHMETTNQALQKRLSELENSLENERIGRMEEVSKLREEIKRLQREMALQLQEYQDLMDIKIALDMEITAYRRMLESEEERLNITPSRLTVSGVDSTPVRGVKRKRTMFDEEELTTAEYKSTATASGEIHIVDEDVDGKYIRLENKGEEEYSLSGHQLVRSTDDESVNPVVYKFHRTYKLAPGAIVTVYSSDAEETHDPPSTLVMKNLKWPSADSITTKLLSGDGDSVCERESKKVLRTVSSYEGRYPSIGKRSSLGGDEKCSIM